MFYSHFDESKKSKIILILCFILAGAFFSISVFAFLYLIVLLFRRDSYYIILFLLLLSVSSIYICKYLLWLLHRVSFSSDGIHVKRLLKQSTYPWESIKEYGIFSISLFTNSNITPYFLFILSSPARVKRNCYNLSMCFFLRRDVIPIRFSEGRNHIIEEIMKEKTKTFDWNDNKWEYEWNPNRVESCPPQSPWPKWQNYEKHRRKKKNT